MSWQTAATVLLSFVSLSQNTFAQRPQGIDVSSFQSNNISWSGVKSQGVTWAFVKAAEGNPAFGYHTDGDFTINEANAKAAGVLISYYYYCHPEKDIGTPGADTEASISGMLSSHTPRPMASRCGQCWILSRM